MRLSPTSTSTRTFVLIPTAVAAEQLARHRPWHPQWAPLLVWGYLQYRLSGSYRLPRSGGSPGMQKIPDELVSSGPYALTRNPMYLGHLIFLTGLTLTTRSPVAAATTAALVPWFRGRARKDEQRLVRKFGADYEAYCRRVPRWLPGTRPAPPALVDDAREATGSND